VLDVGAGNGALLNMLKDSGQHARVMGIDVRRNSMRQLREGVEFEIMDVTKLNFQDGEFDTVVCMEVIEHLLPELVDDALRELRRVAGQRLLVTVPYREQHPLFHHDKPTGHKQSFDGEKLGRLFPNGMGVLIPRSRVDWMMIAEEPSRSRDGFLLLDMDSFCAELNAAPAVRQGVRRILEHVRRRIPVRKWVRRSIFHARRLLGLLPAARLPPQSKP
jgi:SAM-dependent methyltransferase